MLLITHTDDDEELVLTDAIGNGVDVNIHRERGIVSIVLVDSETGKPLAASAEIEFQDLLDATARLS